MLGGSLPTAESGKTWRGFGTGGSWRGGCPKRSSWRILERFCGVWELILLTSFGGKALGITQLVLRGHRLRPSAIRLSLLVSPSAAAADPLLGCNPRGYRARVAVCPLGS